MTTLSECGEHVLAELADGDEVRRVVQVDGPSLTVTEVTSGPVTEVAYGARRHGHKMVADRGAFARVLEVSEDALDAALAAFFAGADEVALLSDLMDGFDRADEPYTYVAWSSEGDIALRDSAAGTEA